MKFQHGGWRDDGTALSRRLGGAWGGSWLVSQSTAAGVCLDGMMKSEEDEHGDVGLCNPKTLTGLSGLVWSGPVLSCLVWYGMVCPVEYLLVPVYVVRVIGAMRVMCVSCARQINKYLPFTLPSVSHFTCPNNLTTPQPSPFFLVK